MEFPAHIESGETQVDVIEIGHDQKENQIWQEAPNHAAPNLFLVLPADSVWRKTFVQQRGGRITGSHSVLPSIGRSTRSPLPGPLREPGRIELRPALTPPPGQQLALRSSKASNSRHTHGLLFQTNGTQVGRVPYSRTFSLRYVSFPVDSPNVPDRAGARASSRLFLPDSD